MMKDFAPQDCPIVSENVGLRPCRKGGVRFELEEIQDKKVNILVGRIFFISNIEKVLHNYGHGGSGVTLSWGCAGHVLALVETVFKHKQ